MSPRSLHAAFALLGVTALSVLFASPRPLSGDSAGVRDWLLVPAPRAGVVWVVGKEVRPREKVPAERLVVRRLRGGMKKYRRLFVGDRVEKGEVVVCLDASLATEEWKARDAAVAASLVEWAAAGRTRDEAVWRYESLLEAARRGTWCDGQEAFRGARLTVERYEAELTCQVKTLRLRQLEADRALAVIRDHEIRSPVDGVVVQILKKEGEAVRQFEGVFRVRIDSGKK
jgi:multidrug efflux pump subunit AcrA (membrane-fusion protein)